MTARRMAGKLGDGGGPGRRRGKPYRQDLRDRVLAMGDAPLREVAAQFIERTFAWLGRNRRLARDFEATVASATAILYAAYVMLLTGRLGRTV